jgi:hypothetical protein
MLKFDFSEETARKTKIFKWFLKVKSWITSEDVEQLECCFLTMNCISGLWSMRTHLESIFLHICSTVSTGRHSIKITRYSTVQTDLGTKTIFLFLLLLCRTSGQKACQTSVPHIPNPIKYFSGSETQIWSQKEEIWCHHYWTHCIRLHGKYFEEKSME